MGEATVGDGDTAEKARWRRRLVAARRAVPPAVHAAEAEAIAASVVAVAASAGGPVCAYVPVGTEPGSIGMLDALAGAGHRVLLPVVPAARGTALDWADYRGERALVAGPLGLLEPTGRRLGPAAITDAELVLVPALAADVRGNRLGRGAGWYDRTLPLARRSVPVVAVLRDRELVARLPVEEHDVRVGAALTPAGGLRRLPAPGDE